MGSSADGKFTRYGVQKMESSGMGVYEKRSLGDGEFTRCGVQQM